MACVRDLRAERGEQPRQARWADLAREQAQERHDDQRVARDARQRRAQLVCELAVGALAELHQGEQHRVDDHELHRLVEVDIVHERGVEQLGQRHARRHVEGMRRRHRVRGGVSGGHAPQGAGEREIAEAEGGYGDDQLGQKDHGHHVGIDLAQLDRRDALEDHHGEDQLGVERRDALASRVVQELAPRDHEADGHRAEARAHGDADL